MSEKERILPKTGKKVLQPNQPLTEPAGIAPITEHLRSLTSLTSTNPQYRAPYDTGALVNQPRNEREKQNWQQKTREELRVEQEKAAQNTYHKSYDELTDQEREKLAQEASELLEKELELKRNAPSPYDEDDTDMDTFLGKKPHQQAQDKPWNEKDITHRLANKKLVEKQRNKKEEKPAQSGKDYFFNPFTGEMEEK